jgi:hypothetical protein
MSNRTGAQGAKEVLSPLRLLFAIFVVTLLSSGTVAQSSQGNLQESPRAAQVRALNNSVLQLHGQVVESGAAQGAHGQASAVLAQRAAALQRLMQENPRAALSFAFSPDLLADLAEKFPDAATLLESHVALTAPVEHWIFDSVNGASSVYQTTVGQQSVTLHFAGREPDLSKSESFRITGVLLGNDLAVLTAEPTRTAAETFFLTEIFRELLRPVQIVLCLACFGALAMLIGRRNSLRFRHLGVPVLAAILTFSSPNGASAQAACSTLGNQPVAVLLVNLPNGNLPSGVTVQSMQDVFFNTSTGVSLDGYLRDASHGQVSASGGVFGPFTLTGSYSSCSDVGGAVLNDAVAAAIASGVNLQNYSRVFLIFPDVFNCGWQGFANAGSCSQITPSGTFNFSTAFISAAYAMPRASGVQLASHEMGHNLGLLHAGLITPATASDVLGPIASAGTENDLGDYWSTMGQNDLGLYPSQQAAEVLNWIAPGANYQVIQSSGTYTLQPLETAPAGLQALKVQRGTGNNQWLWIEFRQPIGSYDSTLLAEPYSGALIHFEDPAAPAGHSYLPNFTPTDTTGFSAALGVGKTWTDSYSNLSLTVQSASSSGLVVNVSYGAVACGSTVPTVVVSPLNPSIYPGQSASYSATVTNNDSSGCASSNINLTSSEPAGWSTSLSASSVSLAPGQTANVTLGKGSPVGTAVGTYAVSLAANNNSQNGQGSANATVVTAPATAIAVSVSVAGSSFTLPGIVPVTAAVTSGGAPVSGASVRFVVALPGGGTTTQTATTGTNGTASWSYRLNAKAAAGAYSVTATGTVSSGTRKSSTTVSASSTAISFVVR